MWSNREADYLKEPELKMELDQGPKTEEGNYGVESFDPRLAATPIVFTTKLEDMSIFDQNIEGMTPEDITNNILKQSMPKYNNEIPITKPASKISIQALEHKIKNINLKLAPNSVCDKINAKKRTNIKEAELVHNVSKRNAKLLGMCKPLRVVLEKLVLENDKEPEPLYKRKKLATNNEFIWLFVFQDNSINQTDIYSIQNGIITENYTLKNVNDEAIIPYLSTFNRKNVIPRKVNFCCWHQRESFIVSLDPCQVKLHVKEFMKTPHCCPFDQCTCCCRSVNEKKYDDIVSSDVKIPKNIGLAEISAEDMEIDDLEKEIAETFHEIKHKSVEYGYKSDWLENLQAETQQIDTLVGKALNYNRLLSKSTIDDSSKFTVTNYRTKFIHQFYSKDVKRAETYELQPEGNLIAYLNQDISSMIMPETYRKSLRNSDEIFLLGRKCCWYEREKNIRRLSTNSSSLARFMKLPHTCLPDECKCCCKPQNTTSYFLNIPLQNRNVPIYTEINKKIYTDKKSNEKIGETSADFCDTKAKTVRAPVLIDSTDKPIKKKSQDEIDIGKIATRPSYLKQKINNKTLNDVQSQKDAIVTVPTITSEIQSNKIKDHLQQNSIVLPTANSAQEFAIGVKAPAIINSTNKPTKTRSQDKVAIEEITTRPPIVNNKINRKIVDDVQSQKHAIVTTKTSEIQSNHSNNQLQQNTILLPTTDNSAQDLAVGSMITTILDRFKNVRLTINKDGKVAAALNAPADTLNTPELKVLANILSHAQKQVKALGLRPGSCLNTNDIQETVNKATLSLPVTQAPLQSQGQIRPIVSSGKISAPETVPKFVNIYPKPETHDKNTIIKTLSNISQDHNTSLLQSYSSYVDCKKNQVVNTVKDADNSNSLLKTSKVTGSTDNKINESDGIPKIVNVFSLQDAENDDPQRKSLKSSALSAWAKSESSDSIHAPKNKITNSEPHPTKIRVVDPAKLGITVTNMIDLVTNDKTQFKILNENLMDAELNSSLNQEQLVPASVQVGNIPMGYIGPEIQSLPKIGNVMSNAMMFPQTISSNTGSQNNILVINPLQPPHFMPENVLTNTGDIQFITPMNMNTIAQNIQVLPQTTSATTVFHISNLDRNSVAEPRLLNAEPVPRGRLNPPPLVRVASKPSSSK